MVDSSYGVGYKIDRVNLMDWLDETVCFEVESWFLIVDYRWNVRCIIYMYVLLFFFRIGS